MTIDGELVLADNGDLAVVYGDEQVAQEALFIMKTQLGDWTLSPSIGAGLEQFVGQPNESYIHSAIEASVLEAIAVNADLPTPTVNCTPTSANEVLVIVSFPSVENSNRQVLVIAGLDFRTGLVFVRSALNQN